MTTRFKGFTVIFDADMREDDAEPLRQAIGCLRGVVKVVGIETVGDDYMARARVLRELREKLWKVLDDAN